MNRVPHAGDEQSDVENLDSLAQMARKGDRRAFERLARAAQPTVYRYAQSVVREHELALEICQETWARAVRSLPRFRGDSAFTTWLIAIERRAIADLLASSRRRIPLADANDRETEATAQFPARTVELGIELDRLSPEMRDALLLTQVVGLSYDEAAEALDSKSGTIKSRVFRAREALVAALADEDREAGSEEAN